MNMIAALYVETDGAYFGIAGVDPWDEAGMPASTPGPGQSLRTRPVNAGVGIGTAHRASLISTAWVQTTAALRPP